MPDYSSRQISDKLIEEIVETLKNIRGWGSVEIFVQDFKVVQIVERNIRKTESPMASGLKGGKKEIKNQKHNSHNS